MERVVPKRCSEDGEAEFGTAEADEATESTNWSGIEKGWDRRLTNDVAHIVTSVSKPTRLREARSRAEKEARLRSRPA